MFHHNPVGLLVHQQPDPRLIFVGIDAGRAVLHNSS